MKRQKLIEELSGVLQRKRAALLQEAKMLSTEEQAVTSERESELEESAQNERIASVIAHLKERDRKTLRDIDAALERVSQGVYGKCAACEGEIGIKRLRALPMTTLCIECATQKEKSAQSLNGSGTGSWYDSFGRQALDDDVETA